MSSNSLQENTGNTEESRNNYWQTALSCIGEGVILTDKNGHITFLNPTAESLCGWSHREAIGRPLHDVFVVIDERDRRPIENPVEGILRQSKKEGLPAHLILITRTGHEIQIEDNVAPIIGADDQLQGIVLVFRDISEKRAASLTNQHLAAIVASSDDIIASKNLDGIITSWNAGAERALGYKAEEVIGRHISILVPDDHLEDVTRILNQIRQGKRVDHYVTKRRTKDGRIIDVSLTVSPIFDAYGLIVGASKVGRDITAQLHAHELQAQLAAVVKFSDDIIASKDLNGIITSWNTGAEKVLGYAAHEVIGKHISMLIPEDVADDFKNILSRISRGESVEHFETRRRRKNGAIIDVSLTVSPIKDISGRIVGASKIGRDITHAKQIQKGLVEKEMELRVLADTIPQLAWMANPDGFIFWYNRRWFEYTGTTLGEMQGWGWQSVHDREFLPAVTKRWKQSIESGESFEMEFPLRGADGRFRWFLTQVNPLKDESGRILRWFGTNTDITAQREQDEALKASEARLR
ncbi:MAG TPA: PAS domain S-box protein, partial [Oligoflexus sp.]|uniref:PAS domain-containing protein n=1 Tax=Oligoflexus sp. TaxID=1971216 RepID=UPI002D2B126F